VIPMVDEDVRSSGPPVDSIPAVRHREVRAQRIPKPMACGCGSAVAFDITKREFFCIGCGSARECPCRRSLLTASLHPVNVA
jgi:hypothetical protein